MKANVTKTYVSAVLQDSNYLPCMKKKSIFIVRNILLASNRSMKVLKLSCTLLITHLVSFNYLLPRFTALYQSNLAKKFYLNMCPIKVLRRNWQFLQFQLNMYHRSGSREDVLWDKGDKSTETWNLFYM